jgi:uncharacterized protein YjbJ (UPF0337 family)
MNLRFGVTALPLVLTPVLGFLAHRHRQLPQSIVDSALGQCPLSGAIVVTVWIGRRVGKPSTRAALNGSQRAKPFFDEEVTVSNPDEVKGRLKEAAGDLTGNADLKHEGKVDRAEGTVKERIDEAGDKLKDVVNPGRDPAK